MRRAAFLVPILALALSLSGCQNLFTTSLASWATRERVSIPPTISATEAQALIDSSSTSQTVLSELLEVLNAQIASGTATTETKALAAQAAIGASGVTETVTSTLSGLLNTTDPNSANLDVNTLLSTVKEGATTNVVKALEGLKDPETLKTADMSATELTVAAIILVVDVLPSGTTDIAALTPEQTASIATSSQFSAATTLIEAAAAQTAASGEASAIDLNSMLSKLGLGS